MDLVLYHLPRDYFTTYQAKVEAVSKADVDRVAKKYLDPDRLAILVVGDRAKVEPALASVAAETRWQFERQGYFVADWKDHAPGRPVFNRTVGLRDTWAKIEKAG